jgi:hypothetical protein
MTISNASYYRNDGYPMLGFELDGHRISLCTDCKPTVHAAGIVCLNSLEDVLPAIQLKADDGTVTTIQGATKDRRVFQLYDQFLRACGDGNFAPGPVTIPA